jgi:hypothetical protein
MRVKFERLGRDIKQGRFTVTEMMVDLRGRIKTLYIWARTRCFRLDGNHVKKALKARLMVVQDIF